MQDREVLSEEQIEKKIQDKDLNAPRVTPEVLNDVIDSVEFVTHVAISGKVLTWCVICLKNGFAVTGDPACAVSVENNVEEIGKDVSYKNAMDKIWPLEGYRLACELAGKDNADI